MATAPPPPKKIWGIPDPAYLNRELELALSQARRRHPGVGAATAAPPLGSLRPRGLGALGLGTTGDAWGRWRGTGKCHRPPLFVLNHPMPALSSALDPAPSFVLFSTHVPLPVPMFPSLSPSPFLCPRPHVRIPIPVPMPILVPIPVSPSLLPSPLPIPVSPSPYPQNTHHQPLRRRRRCRLPPPSRSRRSRFASPDSPDHRRCCHRCRWQRG